MPLPDLAILSDAGGYVIAVGVLIAVIALIVTGRLVPGSVHDRECRRADALDGKLDEVVGTLRDLTGHVDTVIDAAIEKRNRGRT